MRSTLILMLIAASAALMQTAIAHPVDDLEANQMPNGYSTGRFGLSASFNYGDLTFGGPYPNPDKMTNAEKYMVVGATGHGGKGLHAWHFDVFQMVSAIYQRTGEVPPELTKELILSVTAGGEDGDDSGIQQFKSPITDEYPRLNAYDFSPGQVYIRPLTLDDKQFLASKLPELQQHWFDNEFFNPETDCIEQIEVSEVFYIRVYGENQVIYEGFKYTWNVID